jgi:hypothetical protein
MRPLSPGWRPCLYSLGSAAAVLLAVAVVLLNLHWLRGPVENALSSATGREARIRGELRVWPLLPPRLVAGDISLANADWAADPLMLTARRIALQPLFWRLLRGQIAFRSIEADGLRLLLETASDGRGNWQFDRGAEEPGPQRAAPILIRRVILAESQLRFREAGLQTEVTLAARTEAADRPDRNRVRLVGEGSYREAPFDLDARFDVPARINADDLHVDVQLGAKAGATRLNATGSLPAAITTLGAKLQIRLQGDSLGDLYELIGLALPETPPYDLSGELGWRGDRVDWRGFQGRIGDSRMQGDASLDLAGRRPRIVARLKSTRLDFDDVGALFGIPPATGEGETASPQQRQLKAELAARGRVLPASNFKFAKLRSLDADVTLEAGRIEAPKLPLRTLSTHATLSDGVLTFEPLEFAAAGGTLKSRLVFDARRQPLEFDFRIDLQHLKLAELVPRAKSLQDAVGRLDGRVHMHGTGDSIAAMLAGADGRMQVIMGRGEVSNLLLELAGLDVAEALKFLLGKDRKVAIHCAYADFNLQRGIATAEALAVDTADTALLGRGVIDLREERFDITLLPRPKDRSPVSLRSPLKIGGSFLDPSFAPEAGPLLLRGAAVAALAALAPPAALLGLLETGPGEDVSCGPGQRAGTTDPTAEESDRPAGPPPGPRPANPPPDRGT